MDSSINSMYMHMGVSKNRGTPKWMVYNRKPNKMDDLGIPPGNPHIHIMTLLIILEVEPDGWIMRKAFRMEDPKIHLDEPRNDILTMANLRFLHFVGVISYF